ncbi:MAG TPA: sigma-54 dependent transcriptional regulator [Candidatus Polarisedimenticolia bacterium]|nr:sigma-54 dependent transcriptional regulator [Candidatus Polarisedimenticolia bacterium]
MSAVAPVVSLGPLAYRSERMARVVDLARRVAGSDANVLLTGESGTGKERLARYLHEAGPRHAGPFVTVACTTVPSELVESTLFGHEKGAFTGATERHEGRFEQANGGTLLIDGVDELAPSLQGKLLRVVQERAFERLAGTRTIAVDVRILASTQVDLEERVAEGRFRKDLYYRLNVIRIDLPPLRERLEDLPILAEEILRHLALGRGQEPRRLSEEALQRLKGHDWPGNVRELRNTLESATIFHEGAVIPAAAIRIESGRRPEPESSARRIAAAARQGVTLSELEEIYIREVLRRTGNRRSEAARILGINRKTLLEKRKRYRIP